MSAVGDVNLTAQTPRARRRRLTGQIMEGLATAAALLAVAVLAIVLISVAIIADLAWLSFFGGGIGVLGVLLTVNGFFLLVEIPGLA